MGNDYTTYAMFDTDIHKLIDLLALTPCAVCGGAWASHAEADHLWTDERDVEVGM
jgi:hypothetical protein